MKSELVNCLELSCPELFEEKAFSSWLNRMSGRGLATWHVQGEPGEFSDVFVTYDQGEGSDSPFNPDGMPLSVWKVICKECEKHGLQYAVVRLINA